DRFRCQTMIDSDAILHLNNVEPEKWLRYVIEHIQDWPANRVRDLLPWKVDLTAQ
ncbi:TPA: transposase domain-containing protein, partial [Escherichia coli]|nr:transposase domain-containing protein [Escherichia coli]